MADFLTKSHRKLQFLKIMRPMILAVTFSAGFCLMGIARAAFIVTPGGISFTGTAVEFFATEANLINGTGLSGTPTIGNYSTITHGGADGGNAWVTNDPGPAGGDFFADSGGATVVFGMGLGAVYPLTDLVFWGYHFGSANGNEGRQFQLEFSTNGGGSFGTPVVVAQALGTFAVQNAATLSLGGTFNADFVRMTVLDNHFGGPAAGGDRVGLGEVRFIAVPEPSITLLGAFGLIGLMLRRRS